MASHYKRQSNSMPLLKLPTLRNIETFNSLFFLIVGKIQEFFAKIRKSAQAEGIRLSAAEQATDEFSYGGDVPVRIEWVLGKPISDGSRKHEFVFNVDALNDLL